MARFQNSIRHKPSFSDTGPIKPLSGVNRRMTYRQITTLLALASCSLLTACNTMSPRSPGSRARTPYPPQTTVQPTQPPPYTDVVKSTPSRGQAPTRQIKPVVREVKPSAASYAEDQRIAQDFRNSMNMKIEQLAQENARLNGEIVKLRTEGASSPTISEVAALRSKISELEGKIASLEQRTLQNQATLQEIPQTISNLITKQNSGSSGRSAHTNPNRSDRSTARSSGPQEGYEYTVGPGDTLSAIAAAYSVSAQAIIDANDLKNPDNLRVEQKLFIPRN